MLGEVDAQRANGGVCPYKHSHLQPLTYPHEIKFGGFK